MMQESGLRKGSMACMTACPSGVQYNKLIEDTRAQVERNIPRTTADGLFRKLLFATFPYVKRLRLLALPMMLYQRSGLQKLARSSGLLKLLGMAELDALSPVIESDFSFRDLGRMFPAEGTQRGRVALLIGCISSVAFAELNRATVRVLTLNGIEVCIPKEQGCCGALHAHAGLLEQARIQARRNIDAMLSPQFDAVVSNAAGCGCV